MPRSRQAKAARQGHHQRPGSLRHAHDPLRQAHVPTPCDQFHAEPGQQAQQYRGGADRDNWPQAPRHPRPAPPGPARPGHQGRKPDDSPDRMGQRTPGMLRARRDQHAGSAACHQGQPPRCSGRPQRQAGHHLRRPGQCEREGHHPSVSTTHGREGAHRAVQHVIGPRLQLGSNCPPGDQSHRSGGSRDQPPPGHLSPARLAARRAGSSRAGPGPHIAGQPATPQH